MEDQTSVKWSEDDGIVYAEIPIECSQRMVIAQKGTHKQPALSIKIGRGYIEDNDMQLLRCHAQIAADILTRFADPPSIK